MPIRFIAMLAVVLIPVSGLSQATPQGTERTVIGELTDVACHTKSTKAGDPEGGVRDSHAECAVLCVRKGMPAGIVATDGVYWVVGKYAQNDNRALLEFVNKQVRATGTLKAHDGRLSLEVKRIEVVTATTR